MVKHIALRVKVENEAKITEVFSNLKSIIESIVELDIRILTVGLGQAISPEKMNEFLKFYLTKDFIQANKIKVTFIGKWYDLASSSIDIIKEVQEISRVNDSYFLNFVVNYDGQKEVLDSCKILIKKAVAERISVDTLSIEDIKQNIYSSNFVSAEKIIFIGTESKTEGFLLWDSGNSEIIFTKKFAEDFKIDEFKMIVGVIKKEEVVKAKTE